MSSPPQIDGFSSWIRLGIGTLIAVIGGNGIWAVVVVLPAVQREFEIDRSLASMPYSLTMVGFGLGNLMVGKMVDRFGLAIPMAVSAVLMGNGLSAGVIFRRYLSLHIDPRFFHRDWSIGLFWPLHG
ncbi:MAG: hypothetical protein ACJ0DI_00205 [bacterium]